VFAFRVGSASFQEARKRALESPRTKARNDLTQLQSRFHGPGARVAFAIGRSLHDCSWRGLYPNPIGSGTSCRGIVTGPAG